MNNLHIRKFLKVALIGKWEQANLVITKARFFYLLVRLRPVVKGGSRGSIEPPSIHAIRMRSSKVACEAAIYLSGSAWWPHAKHSERNCGMTLMTSLALMHVQYQHPVVLDTVVQMLAELHSWWLQLTSID